eukprot:6031479-Prymnesium_polylepis.1
MPRPAGRRTCTSCQRGDSMWCALLGRDVAPPMTCSATPRADSAHAAPPLHSSSEASSRGRARSRPLGGPRTGEARGTSWHV